MNTIKQNAKIIKGFVFYTALQETKEKEKIKVMILKSPKGHTLQFALAETDWREKGGPKHGIKLKGNRLFVNNLAIQWKKI